jgi:Calcineurin-like phosphoesterase
LSALLIALLLAGAPDAGAVWGRVFDDRNANGRADAGEAGLAAVVVADGSEVTLTDASGAYRIASSSARNVFVVAPGDRVPVGRFYHPRAASVDFALAPSPAPPQWRFAHLSDTHVEPKNVERTRRALLLAYERKAAFAVISGDLVRDALRVDEATARAYFDLYASETARSPLPVRSVMGNHDVFGIERHLSLVPATNPHFAKAMYEVTLGPRYYAFNRGRVHFIVLDTIGVDDLWYYGFLDAPQLAWIAKELQHVPAGSTVVTICHIPLRTAAVTSEFESEGPGRSLQTVNKVTSFRHVVRNVPELRDLLKPYRWTLALQGHMHRSERLKLAGEGAERFHTAPTVGQPDAGIPSGIVVYTVRGDAIDDGEDVSLDE